jgi:RNA polymerase sigma factor (sigma-70 family)
MAAGPEHLLRHIRRLASPPDVTPATDAQLLGRFVRQRDEGAFAALVCRHGPMVVGVCRRVLGDPHEAEDALQATFLILARKAAAVRPPDRLAVWLYGVARQVALNSLRGTARRQQRQARAGRVARPPSRPDLLDELTARELLAAVDEEVGRLPEACRLPVILCCLEGKTQEDAARQLGWTPGSVKGRLERGRRQLHARLRRRGLMVSAAFVVAEMAAGAEAAGVSAELASATARAAAAFAAGQGAGPTVAGRVALLAQGTMKGMAMAKLKTGLALALLMGAMTAAAAALMPGTKPADTPRAEGAQPAPEKAERKEERPGRTDRHGDPLPDGAVARLGTVQRRAAGTKLAMTPDGKSIIGVRDGKYLLDWDAATGQLRSTRQLPGGTVWNHCLSADGRWLATEGPGRGAFTVWDVATGKEARRLAIKDAGAIDHWAFSHDGTKVAATGHEGDRQFVRAWELATGKEVFAKDVPERAGSGPLTFTPDGKRLLASFTSSDVGTFCWDLATGELAWQNKEFWPLFKEFTRDGKVLAAMGEASGVDLATGRPFKLDNPPPLEWNTRTPLAPDGRTLLVPTAEGVIVWDLAAGKELRKLAGAGEDLVIAPDGKAVITNNGALQRWDLATGKPLWPDTFEQGHIGEPRALVFSADGKRLASASADGSVRLWDVTTSKPLHVWRGHEAQRPVRIWRWILAGATALDVSPDGRWVLSAGTEERIRLRDAAAGKEVLTILLPESERGETERRVFHLWISPDGTRATGLFGAQGFSGSTGDLPVEHTHKLASWDLKTGKLLTVHRVEMTSLLSSAISPDGRTLLLNGHLMDAASGREIVPFEGLRSEGGAVPSAFSANGALAAGISNEGNSPEGVKVWEAATGKLVARLKTGSWVAQVTFHPDNRHVVTNGLGGVRVWDLTTGRAVATRTMPDQVRSTTTNLGSYASCLAFAPDGRLATGQPDGTILLWDLPLPPRKPEPLAAKERDALWADLAGDDAGRAWRAVWRLAEAPDEVLPLLRERLRPVKPAPADLTRRLLTELDDASFQRREEAERRLKELGPSAEPALREALRANPSAEQKRHIEGVLTALAVPRPITGEELRQVRAAAILGRVGSAGARRLLTELTEGVEPAPLTRAARAALGHAR